MRVVKKAFNHLSNHSDPRQEPEVSLCQPKFKLKTNGSELKSSVSIKEKGKAPTNIQSKYSWMLVPMNSKAHMSD